jgi:excisionase family DNA binding protein
MKARTEKKATAQTGSVVASKATDELMDMAEAIAQLKTSRPTFYRWVRSGQLRGMKAGRQWRFYRADVERFMKGDAPRIELTADIDPLIQTLQKKLVGVGAKKYLDRDFQAVEGAVDLMILLGAAMRASDLHIGAQMVPEKPENTGFFRCRVDGVLHTAATFDIRLLPAIVERWKVLCHCDINEKQKPQDGRATLDAAGKKLDLRVNFLPAITGESITAHILDRDTVKLDLDRIDYAAADKEKILRALKAPAGMIVVTGPAGCGKTTVVYSFLNKLVSPDIKIVTVEDPVCYALPWATQIQVRPIHSSTTYPAILRAISRSSPDVIMIGEIKDAETLLLGQEIALEGHLVLTTLHTDDAAAALIRMRDIGSEPFVIEQSMRLIVAQRLIRKLCPHCSVPEKLTPEQASMLSGWGANNRFDWRAMGNGFRKPVGCPKCGNTGYRGRTVVAEALEMSPEIGRALRESTVTSADIRKIAIEQGMTTILADGVRRAAKGEIFLGEIGCYLARLA